MGEGGSPPSTNSGRGACGEKGGSPPSLPEQFFLPNSVRQAWPIPYPSPSEGGANYADWSLSQDVRKEVFGRFPRKKYVINEAHKQ